MGELEVRRNFKDRVSKFMRDPTDGSMKFRIRSILSQSAARVKDIFVLNGVQKVQMKWLCCSRNWVPKRDAIINIFLKVLYCSADSLLMHALKR